MPDDPNRHPSPHVDFAAKFHQRPAGVTSACAMVTDVQARGAAVAWNPIGHKLTAHRWGKTVSSNVGAVASSRYSPIGGTIVAEYA